MIYVYSIFPKSVVGVIHIFNIFTKFGLLCYQLLT